MFIFAFNVLVLFVLPLTIAAAAPVPDRHYCNSKGQCDGYFVADSFVDWNNLLPMQIRLLQSAGIISPLEQNTGVAWQNWATNHDDQAAAFLAVTMALSRTEFILGNGKKIFAIELLTRMSAFLGDRIHAILDPVLFQDWRKAGGKYIIYKADGKTESGHFGFHPRSWLGGSLHEGYDIQGWTSTTRMPRIQINYRNSDSEADIDLD